MEPYHSVSKNQQRQMGSRDRPMSTGEANSQDQPIPESGASQIVLTQISEFRTSIPNPDRFIVRENPSPNVPETLPPSLSQGRATNEKGAKSIIDVDALCENRMAFGRTSDRTVISSAVNQVSILPGSRNKSADSRMSSEYVFGNQSNMEDKNDASEIEEVGRLDQYDSDTVRTLMSVMKQCGYKDRRKKKKSMKQFWADVMKTANRTCKITKSARSWEMKYCRLKKAYESYTRRVNVSGREGDDDELYTEPKFFREIHELESSSARNTLIGAMWSEMPSTQNVYGKKVSSTRKRTLNEKMSYLKEVEERTNANHAEMLNEVREGNKYRADLVGLVGELVKAVKSNLEKN